MSLNACYILAYQLANVYERLNEQSHEQQCEVKRHCTLYFQTPDNNFEMLSFPTL